MKLQLTRKTYTKNSTIGDLEADGKFQCFTLEDPVRPAKIAGTTAIPAGTYNVLITWSNKFKKDMPLLDDVPGFEGIRIHSGNTAADTLGCVLVGKSKATDSIASSRIAYDELFALIKKERDAGRAVSMKIVEGGKPVFGDKAAPALTIKGGLFRVTADPLRIRSSASGAKTDNVIGRLPFGTMVAGTGRKAPAEWVEVDAVVDGAKLSGFVAEAFLEAVPAEDATRSVKPRGVKTRGVKDSPPPSGTSDLFRVNASSLNLRSKAGSLSGDTIIASLPRDHLVRKLGETAEPLWWKVAAVLHGKSLQGFANAGFLVAENATQPSPSDTKPTATGGVKLSEKALKLILEFEGMDQPSRWPGQQSGISLGHGYDLGYHTRDALMSDWGPHLSSEKLNLLATAIGVKGAAAAAIAGRFKSITVTVSQADAVFMVSTVPKITGWALTTFPGILALPADAQGALVSLVYNRGTDLSGDRRREMRDIRDTVGNAALGMAEKLSHIAASLREMKRIWPSNDPQSGHPGIRRRREAEAMLVQNADSAPRGLATRDTRQSRGTRALRSAAPEVLSTAPQGMVADYLDRETMITELQRQLDALEKIKAQLNGKDLHDRKAALAALKAHDISPYALDRVINALKAAITKAKADKKHPSGTAYIPSDPVTCGLQASLTAIAINNGLARTSVKPPQAQPATRGSRRARGVACAVAADTSAPLRLRRTREPFVEGNPLDNGDPLYALDGFKAKFAGLFDDPRDFNPNPAKIARTQKSLALFLFGDWGTGLPLAAEVTKRVGEQVAKVGAAQQPHVIHLGDVYYVGEAAEYRDRMLPFWPVPREKRDAIGSWSLNGNHDMYSGGQGYFDTLLRQDVMLRWHGDKSGAPSSFFVIEDPDWQVFGLDTSWSLPSLTSVIFGKPTKEDFGGQNGVLTSEQAKWMAEVRNHAKGCILLTHHQPASSRSGDTQHSDQAVALLKEHKVYDSIDAWIWGHEHRCVIFKPKAERKNKRLKDAPEFCACVGHGGVPVTAKNFDAAKRIGDVLWEEDRLDASSPLYEGLRVVPFGFARIDTGPGGFHFRVFDHTGSERCKHTVKRQPAMRATRSSRGVSEKKTKRAKKR